MVRLMETSSLFVRVFLLIIEEQNGASEYHLTGIINHSGSGNSGHYYSHIKVGSEWFYFSDSIVKKFGITGLSKKNPLNSRSDACCLFYTASNIFGVLLMGRQAESL